MDETDPVVTLLTLAAQETIQSGYAEITLAHLLIALSKVADEEGAAKVPAPVCTAIRNEFASLGLEPRRFRRRLRKLLGNAGVRYAGGTVHRSPACRAMFTAAQRIAQEEKEPFDARHLVRAAFAALAVGQPLQGKTIAAVVRQRFEKVRTCKKTDGPSAAASYGQDLARRDEEELERIYGFLNGATQLLLALGFLGTVWGISQSMFGAFGNLSGATTDHLKLLLENFSGALSTALDTTVLGIVCSVIVTLILTATQWAETSTLRALTTQVSSQLSLETALYNREGELWQKLQARCSTLAEPLLRGIVEPLVQEMAAGMRTMAGQTLQLYDAKLGEIVQQHLARLQEHERQVADKLAAVLTQQMAAVLQAVEAHGEQARVALIAELRRIGQQLYRMPEIAIRYPEQNGADAEHH